MVLDLYFVLLFYWVETVDECGQDGFGFALSVLCQVALSLPSLCFVVRMESLFVHSLCA